MIKEMTAEELEADCRTFIALQTKDIEKTKAVLNRKYSRVETDEEGFIRIYDNIKAEEAVEYLYKQFNIAVTEIRTDKIGLEEYYIDLMKEGR